MLLASKQTLNPSTSHYLPCDLVKQWSWCKPYSVLTWVIFILSKLVSFIYSGLFADESISQNNYFHVTALPEFLWKIPISLGIEGSPYHGGRSLLQPASRSPLWLCLLPSLWLPLLWAHWPLDSGQTETAGGCRSQNCSWSDGNWDGGLSFSYSDWYKNNWIPIIQVQRRWWSGGGSVWQGWHASRSIVNRSCPLLASQCDWDCNCPRFSCTIDCHRSVCHGSLRWWQVSMWVLSWLWQ